MSAASANPELLNTLLTQLSARIIADQTANDERFRTVHEDARRDRREVLTSLSDLREELHTAFKDGFAALEAKVGEVCDRGGAEHANIIRNHSDLVGVVTSLADWRQSIEDQAKGAERVIEGQKGAIAWAAQNAVPLVAAALAILSLFKDDIPQITITPAASASQLR